MLYYKKTMFAVKREGLDKKIWRKRHGWSTWPGFAPEEWKGGTRGRNRMGKHVNPDGIQSWKILRSVEQDRSGLKSVIQEGKASTQ